MKITIPPKPEKPENHIQQIAVNAREAAKLLGISHGTLTLLQQISNDVHFVRRQPIATLAVISFFQQI